jgi:competence protein ComEC
MPLAKLSVMICLGIAIADMLSISVSDLILLCSISAILLLSGIYYHFRNRTVSSILMFVTTFCIGILVHTAHAKEFNYNHYSKKENNKVLFVEIKSKKLNKKNIQCTTRVLYSGNTLDSLSKCDGHLLVYFPIEDAYRIKEGIRIILPNNAYKIFENPNPLTFDYKEFLSRKKIYQQAYAYSDQYTIVSQSNLNVFKRIAYKSKNHIQNLLNEYVTDNQNKAIAQAMLLGDRSLVDDDLNAAYSDTGAIHILAVSGLHVGIVGLIILFLLKPFKGFRYSNNITFLIALLAIWLYVFMTGSGPPSIRAAAMYSAFLAAPIVGKYLNPYNTIGTAATAILLYNPNQLFTVSFQFSFIAVLSIIFFFPLLDKMLLSENKIIRKLYQLVILSVSAQLLLTPLSIYYFHKFPLLFFISGMVAVPMAFVILMISIVMTISSCIPFISDVVTPLIAELLNLALYFLNFSIHWINEFPYTIIDNIWIDKNGLLLSYSALLFLVIGLKIKKAKLVYLFFGILIFLGLIHRHHKIKIWEEASINVYHIYKNNIVEYISNGYRSYLCHNIEKESTERWNCRNYRTKNMVVDTMSIDKRNNIEMKYGLYNIKDKLIIVDPSSELKKYRVRDSIELYIITNDNYELHKTLISKNNIKQIVIDGNVIKNKYRFKKIAEEKNILFHDTADGAYLYKL